MCRSMFRRSRALRAARNDSKSTFPGLGAGVAFAASVGLMATLVAARSGIFGSFLAICWPEASTIGGHRSWPRGRSGTVCGLFQQEAQPGQERARHLFTATHYTPVRAKHQ